MYKIEFWLDNGEYLVYTCDEYEKKTTGNNHKYIHIRKIHFPKNINFNICVFLENCLLYSITKIQSSNQLDKGVS